MKSTCLIRAALAVLFAFHASVSGAEVQLVPVLSGLASPIFVGHAGDDSNRLFIVEQGGVIKVLQPGSSNATTFLNITSKVLSGGERGLLGLAFHPQYWSNARFFVFYTRPGDGALVVAEYKASAANPDVADPAERVFLTIPHPSFSNHNGGMLAFGFDGYLYIGVGDGGSGNDPSNNAQNINVLLGKILRINVDVPDTPAGTLYSSPPDNPFVGRAGRDEIFAYGLRNPWRFSFDRITGDQWVGDVGQGAREEVDRPIVKGGNYGWRNFEGNLCTGLGPCDPTGLIFPVFDYTHMNGRCSLTGGYVYRGVANVLQTGTYVYGDYCSGEVFTWDGSTHLVLFDTSLNISSFGEDQQGEIYVVGLGGTVYRLESPTPPPPPGQRRNVASASNGGSVSASTFHSSGFAPASAINGDRAGTNWGNGGGWNDGTPNAFPDWLEIAFNGTKTIDEVSVFTVQDAYASPAEPTAGMTFTAYGLTDFLVQYWNGTQWVTVPNGTIVGNNLVWRKVTFPALATTKIRVFVTGALNSWTRITEVEAYGADDSSPPPPPPPPPPPGRLNVAGASNGGSVSASSFHSSSFAPAGAINGDRAGTDWGNGGGWNDGTPNAFPDWLEIAFNGSKTIDEVSVFTVQDAYASPVEPTAGMTFTAYGLTDFLVQYWSGTQWVTVPNGTIVGNNLVWRKVTFPALATTKIRVFVTGALNSWTRITEVEAYQVAQ